MQIMMVNNMIKYKYLYDNYLEKLDKMRNDLSDKLEIKVNNKSREILYLNEYIQKTNKAYIIICIIGALFLYPFYIFMQEYLYLWSILIYLGFFALMFLAVFIIKIVLKSKVKALENENISKDSEEFKQEYSREQDKIIDIALFIIVANENYAKLVAYSGEKQKEIYEKLKENRKNIIDISMNYKPNPEKYQRYLDEWIKLREESEEN